MSGPVFDLLRERRQALGVEPVLPTLSQRDSLLRRGLLLGTGLLGVALGLTALLYLRLRMVQSEMGELQQYEAQSTQLQAELTSRKSTVERLLVANRQLAEGLTTVRSSSALLADLQLRTPDGVQLVSAVVNGNALAIKGKARDPQAFERINAMLLELKRSPLFDPAAVALTRAVREEKGEEAADTGAMPAVSFELTAPFQTLPPLRQLQVLRQLGAQGIARRLERVQGEGLMP